MKRNHVKRTFALAASALAITTAVVGCRDYDVMDEQKAHTESALENFSNNFVAQFGEPDPNHTWGFGINADMVDEAEMQKYVDAWRKAGMAVTTRGESGLPGGAVNTNTNQWTENNTGALKNNTTIPGWPNDDNWYYTRDGVYSTEYDAIGHTTQGDITKYEIEYVSRWFREHKNPVGIQLHISDFFIQQVSTDYDRLETIPDKACNGERITRWDDPNQPMEYKMDKLDFLALDGSWTHVNNFNASQNLIVLHSGETSDRSGDKYLSYRNIMYVTSSGTENFEYHASLDNISGGFFSKWVLVKIDWVEPVMPSGETNVPRTGYYLAFDYQCKYEQNGTTYTYEPDGYYSNWIVKLTPGYFKQMERWPKRFMTEDLGDTYDFDFNDAVFDLTFASNANDGKFYDAVLTIQAAAGTMPIYIGVSSSNSQYEIHRLLGQDSHTKPVNAGKNTAHSEPAIYRVKRLFKNDDSYVVWETDYLLDEEGNRVKDGEGHYIPIGKHPVTSAGGWDREKLLRLQAQMAMAAFGMEIYIVNPDPSIGEQSVNGWTVSKNLRDYYKWKTDGSEINSTHPAPQLFNCSTKAKWMQELEPISTGYEHFRDWVQDEQCDWRLEWDKNGYFYRVTPESGQQFNLEYSEHTPDEVTSWKGAWDQNPKPGALLWSSDMVVLKGQE